MNRRKIAIIHAGGTTCMRTDRKTLTITPVRHEEESFESIHRFLPEIQKFTSVDFFPLYDTGSSEIQPKHWQELAEFIYKKMNDYEGFVVIHGTNTMSYTASALSFALQNLSVPIVFTGGIRPISDLSTDARQNIVFACMLATMDIAEVCVVYGKKILRGNCSKKISESFGDVFIGTERGKLGEIHRTILLHENRLKRRKRNLIFKPNFRGIIPVIRTVPGLDVNIYECMMDKIDGIMIAGYGPGHIPEKENSWFPFIKKIAEKGKPILIHSQMHRSEVMLHAYKQGEKLLELGCISTADMTIECSYAKLLWCLGQNMTLHKIKETMIKNIVEELTTENQTIEVW